MSTLKGWTEIEPGCFEKQAKIGEIIIEGKVILGGNGLWGAHVYKTRRGRPKKHGIGRIAGKTLELASHHQVKSCEEVLKWADSTWSRMWSEEAIEDGFGSVWSAWCPTCQEKTMEIVRPGKVQCRNCC